jgi:uncharacterized membrane protein
MATSTERPRGGTSRRSAPARRSGAGAAPKPARTAAARTGTKAATKSGTRAAEKGTTAAAKNGTTAAAKKGTTAAAKKGTMAAARKGTKASVTSLVPGGGSAPGTLARAAALKAARAVARRALGSGAELVRSAVDAVGDGHGGAITERLRRRIPIQRSVDIAVPLGVAWEEWMALEELPEGVDRVEEVEHDGDAQLVGCTTSGVEWEAEILDERERQSFAWQSHAGSDVAGLVTFHQLSERLTRVELTLDILPTSAAQAMSLATRLADRRAASDLRRLKARLELINPDVYDHGSADR